jgi:ubiquinone/menaquinone biosynthesis C-methylase UbiE
VNNPQDEVRAFWSQIAEDWYIQVGEDGDANRLLNSDPVLWEFAGDVRGLRVLDAGSGTGYISKKMSEKGAHVTGIDVSDRMIAIARQRYPDIEFRVDSCGDLRTCGDAEFDLIVSNYVLMDTPDLESAVRSFFRVLRPRGRAVLVFSHPCFPQGRKATTVDGSMTYHWPESYFERRKEVDPPWGHFKSEFIWFHRPLSDYWKAFVRAGFAVTGFEEPRLTEERYHLAETPSKLHNHRTRPYSVAFQLEKR